MLSPKKRGQIAQFQEQMMTVGSASDYRYGFGIVVNPRTGEPFICCSGEIGQSVHRSRFEIRRMDGSREGAGMFEEYNDGPCFEAARLSGFPRVHVPEGVVRRGKGNGTALYVASTVAVYASANSQNDFELKWNPDDEQLDPSAVCSSPLTRDANGDPCDRSKEASKWWDRAVRQHLAERREDESATPRSIDDCLSPDQSRDLLHRFVDDVSDESDLGDVDVSICATGEYEVISRTQIDTLEFEHVKAVNLVVAYTTAPAVFRWLDGFPGLLAPNSAPAARRELDEWEYFNPEAARAVNVGIFREFGDSERVFASWLAFCLGNGLERRDAEQMTDRWRAGIDLNPAAVGKEQVRPRSNPARRSKASSALVQRYGRARRNPDESPAKLAAELLEERRRLGWTKLADLP